MDRKQAVYESLNYLYRNDLSRNFNSVTNSMDDILGMSHMNKNVTDVVGSPPILNPKGTT